MDLLHLVLGQGLCGEQIKGARFRLCKYPLEHRQVIAEGFAAGGGRHQDHIAALPDKPNRFGLMAIEPPDPTVIQYLAQAGMDPIREKMIDMLNKMGH